MLLVFDIGNSNIVELNAYIEAIEKALGKKAKKVMLPMQPGDVLETSADTSALERVIGFKPHTKLSEGLAQFVSWYRGYYPVR